MVYIMRPTYPSTESGNAGNLRNFLGVMTVFREDQRLRHLGQAGKQLVEQVGFEDGADLIGHQHRAIDLVSRIAEISVESVVALRTDMRSKTWMAGSQASISDAVLRTAMSAMTSGEPRPTPATRSAPPVPS